MLRKVLGLNTTIDRLTPGQHCAKVAQCFPGVQILYGQCLLPEETCQEEPFLDAMLAANNMRSWLKWGKTLAPLEHVLPHHVDGRMLHSGSAAHVVGSSNTVPWAGEALSCPPGKP